VSLAVKLLPALVLLAAFLPAPALARPRSQFAAPVSVPDGSGGLYIAWADARDGSQDIFLLRVTNTGVVASGWPATGLAVCSAVGDQIEPTSLPDGSNGVIVFWADYRNHSNLPDGYAQRVSPAGVPQWVANGVKVLDSALHGAAVAPDGSGGLLAAWSAKGAVDQDLIATRITSTGALASGWSASGVLVCGLAADQTAPAVTSDGSGGAFVAWVDARSGLEQTHIYAQRLDGSGAAQWPTNGILVDGSSRGASAPALCPDGFGGMFALWSEPTGGGTVYAQRMGSVGLPQWMTGGVNAGGTDSIAGITIVPDGMGGVLAAWNESSAGSEILRAQRLNAAGGAQWGAIGVAISSSATDAMAIGDVVADGTGAACIVWQDPRNGSGDPDIFTQRLSATGSPLWTANGLAVCSASGVQSAPTAALDGSGGLVVGWQDRRELDAGIFVQRFTSSGIAQLAANGIAAYQDPGGQSETLTLQSDTGGAFVFWNEKRGGQYDIMARKLDADGTPTGTSVALCAAAGHQLLDAVIDDGAGGAIVSWTDRRNGAVDIYGQRIDANVIPQWAANGAVVCTASGPQKRSRMVSDGAGGAILAWQDERVSGNSDVYAQRLSAAGSPLWMANGIAVCADPGGQHDAVIAADGAGGAIIAWADFRNVLMPAVYAQRLNGSGVTQWTADGSSIATCPGLAEVSDAVPGLANDAIILLSRSATDVATGAATSLLCAQKVNATGVAQWGAAGVMVCDGSSFCSREKLVTDGAGGVYVAWSDGRNDVFDLYLQRINATGVPQWAADGVVVCNAPGWQYLSGLTRDASGGPCLVWDDQRSGQMDIYAHHFDSSGVPQWAVNGVAVCSAAGGQYLATVAPWRAATPGRHFVSWTDARTGSGRYAYLQQLDDAGAIQWALDGLTPTLLAMVRASADAQRVHLLWYASTDVVATVYRRSPEADWFPIGQVISDGTGQVAFEDRDITPGERYGYRLGILEMGSETFTGEVWVEVPAELALALEGLRPNPAVSDPVVSFTLASRDAARLELADVAGRRVLVRDLTGLSPGRHTLRLDTALPPAGLYFLRLTQGGHSVTVRAVIAR
jgi:hypothetical protein